MKQGKSKNRISVRVPVSILARVARVSRLTTDIFSVWLEAAKIAGRIMPGQFIGVKVPGRIDLLLRRPLSVADVIGSKLRVVFRVVGAGTRVLSQAQSGEEWNILGPLGRPAPLPENREVILCGGGIGVAPLLYLARVLTGRHNRILALLGAKTRTELIMVRDFRSMGVEVFLTTEDGSCGRQGLVTEMIEEVLAGVKRPVVFACGPEEMLSAISGMVRERETRSGQQVAAFGFVEGRMGCGVGICYGCALKRRDGGYIRVCRDGPVVPLSEVAW